MCLLSLNFKLPSSCLAIKIMFILRIQYSHIVMILQKYKLYVILNLVMILQKYKYYVILNLVLLYIKYVGRLILITEMFKPL